MPEDTKKAAPGKPVEINGRNVKPENVGRKKVSGANGKVTEELIDCTPIEVYCEQYVHYDGRNYKPGQKLTCKQYQADTTLFNKVTTIPVLTEAEIEEREKALNARK